MNLKESKEQIMRAFGKKKGTKYCNYVIITKIKNNNKR